MTTAKWCLTIGLAVFVLLMLATVFEWFKVPHMALAVSAVLLAWCAEWTQDDNERRYGPMCWGDEDDERTP